MLRHFFAPAHIRAAHSHNPDKGTVTRSFAQTKKNLPQRQLLAALRRDVMAVRIFPRLPLYCVFSSGRAGYMRGEGLPPVEGRSNQVPRQLWQKALPYLGKIAEIAVQARLSPMK